MRGEPPAAGTNATAALSHGYAHSASSVLRSGERATTRQLAYGSRCCASGPATTFQLEPVSRSMLDLSGSPRFAHVRKPRTGVASHIRSLRESLAATAA